MTVTRQELSDIDAGQRLQTSFEPSIDIRSVEPFGTAKLKVCGTDFILPLTNHILKNQCE